MSPVQAAIERTVVGMGYELVDVEFAGGGLLRVYIDLPASAYAVDAPLPADGLPPSVRVEDCERVSHQLSHVLTVENIDYARLEVSSPGMDRPLRRASDFERFMGHEVSVRLRQPLAGRRNFTGVLLRDDASPEGGAASPEHWVLELSEPSPVGAVAGKGRVAAGKAGGAAKSAKAARVGPKAGLKGARKAAQEVGQDAGPAHGEDTQSPGRSGGVIDAQEPQAASAAATDTPQPDSGVETVRRLTFTLDEIERARLVPRYKF